MTILRCLSILCQAQIFEKKQIKSWPYAKETRQLTLMNENSNYVSTMHLFRVTEYSYIRWAMWSCSQSEGKYLKILKFWNIQILIFMLWGYHRMIKYSNIHRHHRPDLPFMISCISILRVVISRTDDSFGLCRMRWIVSLPLRPTAATSLSSRNITWLVCSMIALQNRKCNMSWFEAQDLLYHKQPYGAYTKVMSLQLAIKYSQEIKDARPNAKI